MPQIAEIIGRAILACEQEQKIRHIENSRNVAEKEAVAAFAALGQSTRLRALRLLLESEPAGIPAGLLAAKLGVPQNSLSGHLGILESADLVRGERLGRSIVYHADLSRGPALAAILLNQTA